MSHLGTLPNLANSRRALPRPLPRLQIDKQQRTNISEPPLWKHSERWEQQQAEAAYTQLFLQYYLLESEARRRSKKATGSRRQLALLIPGRNEELVIEHTIMSAMNAGLAKKDIYFVDDGSTDSTVRIARRLLGQKNVHRVSWGGKGKAIKRGVRHFGLVGRYEWIHIADADGSFATDYFSVMKQQLDPRYAAATGYIKSLKGSMVGQYRVYEYTFGMEIVRRFQSVIGTIPIIPGPTSCFRSDVMQQVNFANGSLTEDFDVTLQIHRQKLGGIQFIEDAVALTQDPLTVKDFIRQIRRWNKGVLQGLMKYRIGTHLSKIDAYLTYQMWLNFSFMFSYLVILPMSAMKYGVVTTICLTFLADMIGMLSMLLLIAHKARRWDIIASFPNIYGLRWVSVGVFAWAFAEVMLSRGKLGGSTWISVKRQRQLAV